jgi:Lon protease-like protein
VPVIPLFPLGTLLVPGQALPLRLFEDRYLALHDDLMARPEDQRSVGIVLIQGGSEVGDGNAGRLAPVGTEGVLQRSEEADLHGSRVVMWELLGHRRFRLDGMPSAGPTAYLTAEVGWLADDDRAPFTHRRAADPAARDALAAELIRHEQWLQSQFGGRPIHQMPGGESLN